MTNRHIVIKQQTVYLGFYSTRWSTRNDIILAIDIWSTSVLHLLNKYLLTSYTMLYNKAEFLGLHLNKWRTYHKHLRIKRKQLVFSLQIPNVLHCQPKVFAFHLEQINSDWRCPEIIFDLIQLRHRSWKQRFQKQTATCNSRNTVVRFRLRYWTTLPRTPVPGRHQGYKVNVSQTNFMYLAANVRDLRGLIAKPCQ